MAILTLTATNAYTVNFTISGLDGAYVNSAMVSIFDVGSSVFSPVQSRAFTSDEVAGATTISGSFMDLASGTQYIVWAQVFDRDGKISSERTGRVLTYAEIAITSSLPYRIDYTLIWLLPEYVDRASVDLYDVAVSETTPAQTRFFSHDEVAGSESISGYFEDLTPNTEYSIWSYVYDAEGKVTSTRNVILTTPSGLTLFASSPYRLNFIVTDLIPEYVWSAAAELYDTSVSMAEPVQTRFFHSGNVKGSESIFDYFVGLTPGHEYIIWSYVYDRNGESTSTRHGSIVMPSAPRTKTENGPVHTVNVAVTGENHVYNTFLDWCLVAAEVPVVNAPPLKSKYVDLPASDGVLDYTELLLGAVPFGRRTGSWRFYTDLDRLEAYGLTWDTLYAAITAAVHGREVRVSLSDDPGYYYLGRLMLKSWKSLKEYSEIAIDYDLSSYKYGTSASDDFDWQWDVAMETPDFEVLYGNYVVREVKVLNYINHGGQSTTPDWTVTGGNVTVRANLGEIVQQVIRGDWGLGTERQQRLEDAGYCYEIVQNAVNEALGNDARLPVPEGEGVGWDKIVDSDAGTTMRDVEASGELSTGELYELLEGENTNANLSLAPGENVMVLTGDGTMIPSVTTTYREVGL